MAAGELHLEYGAVVIGASAGGLAALTTVLQGLPVNYGLPVVVVQHRSKSERDLLEEVLQKKCVIKIKQADEKEKINAAYIYIAPPDYHLLIEQDFTFSLSADQRVNHSRPAIDVLFETAAQAYKHKLIGIILTGFGIDGANGVRAIHNNKGITLVQDPAEAEFPEMPRAAIQTGIVKKILPLQAIADFMITAGKS